MMAPQPVSGYAYALSHADAARSGSWSKASNNDDWDSVVISPRHTSNYMWVGRRNIDGSEVNVWDDAHGRRYIAQTTVMTGRQQLTENQTSVLPWVIGALALGGLVWWLTNLKNASASPSSPVGCPITQKMLDDFSKTKGYTSIIIPAPVPQWAAPKDATKNPKSRFLSSQECVFYKWDGAKWIVDTKTSEEFITWANANVVKGHPTNLFLP